MDSLERIPPQAIEAEHSVLGAILINAEALDKASEILTAADFYNWQHGMIFRTALELVARNVPADLVTVSQALREKGELDEVGGYPYLMDLSASIPTAANVEYYAKIVKRKAEARRAIALGQKIVEAGYDPESKDPLETATGLLIEAVNQNTGSDIRPLVDIVDGLETELDEAIACFKQYAGARVPGRILTGLPELDQFTMGFGEDHMVVVAGRPGMGKSSLLFQVAQNIAAGAGGGEHVPVVAFSLEMGQKELTRRLACGMARLNSERIALGYVTDREQEMYQEALAKLAAIPLYIDESPAPTIARIRNEARRLKARHGRIGAVVVDHIGLMTPMSPEGKRTHSNRQEEVSAMSRGLKTLAMELKCPVIVGSQLNRGVEIRGEKRPVLADLRESGALEQDANLVLMLYRDEYYNPESVEKGIVEINVAKNRGGRTGTVKMGFDLPSTHFYSLTKPWRVA